MQQLALSKRTFVLNGDRIERNKQKNEQVLRLNIPIRYTHNKREKNQSDIVLLGQMTQNTEGNQLLQQKQPQVYKNIRTIKKVARFIDNTKMRLVRQQHNLTPQQMFYLEVNKNNGQQSTSVLPWNHSLLTIYKIVTILWIILNVWLNTYQIVFQKIQQSNIFRLIGLITVLFKVALQLNSEFKTPRLTIIKDRFQVAKLYAKNQLGIMLPIFASLIIPFLQIQYLYYPSRALCLFSIAMLSQIWQSLNDQYGESVQAQRKLKIIELIFLIFTFLHFISLFLNLVAKVQLQNNVSNSWIEHNNLLGSNNLQLYIQAYYWGSTIVSTVGFGDLTPANVYERGIFAFIIVFCSLFFGYCLSIIGNILGVIGQSNEKHQKQMRRLNKYLRGMNISDALKNQLKSFYYNKQQIQQTHDFQIQEGILNTLTKNLKNQLLKQNNIQIVNKCKQLKEFSKQTKQKIALHLSKKLYSPQEIVYDQKTYDSNLIIIQQGKIQQYCILAKQKSENIQQKIVNQYTHAQGNTIGWNKLVVGGNTKTFSKASNFAVTFQISKQNLLQIIGQNKDDRLKFNQIKERLLTQQNKLNKKCIACKKLNHNVIQCPKIHYIPYQSNFIAGILKRKIQMNNRRNSKFIRFQKNTLLIKIELDTQQFERSETLLTSKNLMRSEKTQRQVQSTKINLRKSHEEQMVSYQKKDNKKQRDSIENKLKNEQLVIVKNELQNFENVMLSKQECFFPNSNLMSLVEGLNKLSVNFNKRRKGVFNIMNQQRKTQLMNKFKSRDSFLKKSEISSFNQQIVSPKSSKITIKDQNGRESQVHVLN